MKASQKRFLMGNFIIQGQWENQMGGRHPEGRITEPRNTRMKDTSRRLRRMDESSEGGNGPEGALAS